MIDIIEIWISPWNCSDFTMTSSQNRRARSPLSDKTEGHTRSRSLSKKSNFDSKSVFAYVKGIPMTSHVPSKRSKVLSESGLRALRF